jgi:hypothetical protein
VKASVGPFSEVKICACKTLQLFIGLSARLVTSA